MEAYLAGLLPYLSSEDSSHGRKFAGLNFQALLPIISWAWPMQGCGRKTIKLCPIQRQGAGYHSLESDRICLRNGPFVKFASVRLSEKFTQPIIARDGSQGDLVGSFPYLRYQIVTCLDFDKLCQVNQEFAVRIREALKSSETIEELIEQVATKRYTKGSDPASLIYPGRS